MARYTACALLLMGGCALSQTRQAPLTAAEQATALKAIRYQ